MDLRSKLNFYKENMQKQEADLASGNLATGNLSGSTSGNLAAGNLSGSASGNLPAGRVVTNDGGSFYMMENEYPLSFIHGSCALSSALGITGGSLSALFGEGFSQPDIKRFLFLDTETTGLSGGAGTVAFLAGTGFFTDEAFVIRQYFMRDYDEEPAMLSELNELLSGCCALVTFNGKAFDWNLLSGRFISNRIRPLMKDPRHIDLLYPSRRLWGLKYESCRLSSLEENVLGLKREDDIPGALIPAVYFKYLEDGGTADINKVIKHNEMDILTMVPLLTRMCALAEKPLLNAGGEHELLGLGRMFEARGEFGRMVECLESCARSGQYSIRSKAVKHLTGVYKRHGSYDKAMEHWLSIASDSEGFDLFALVQIAMYYEHKQKDPIKALETVETALQACLKAGLNGSRQFEELRRRQDRLRRKTLKI